MNELTHVSVVQGLSCRAFSWEGDVSFEHSRGYLNAFVFCEMLSFFIKMY